MPALVSYVCYGCVLQYRSSLASLAEAVATPSHVGEVAPIPRRATSRINGVNSEHPNPIANRVGNARDAWARRCGRCAHPITGRESVGLAVFKMGSRRGSITSTPSDVGASRPA